MRAFIDPHVLARLSALPLYARSPMAGSVSGKHRSLSRGSSLEFSEYRKYVPGDDTRRLDWRAWGRSDRFYIKEYEADTNLRLCLIVDTSGSMDYQAVISGRQDGSTRLDYAKQLAGTLACLAAEQGDAVGLYVAGEGVRKQIAPRRSTAHLKYLLDELSTLKAEGETGLSQALHSVAEQIPGRALVVIISDLFTDPAELESCFQHLRFRHHDVVMFHLLEQAELEFRFDRPVRFVDLEGAPAILVDPVTVAREYRDAVQKWLEQIRLITRSTTVDYHRMSMNRNYADALADFLLARNR